MGYCYLNGAGGTALNFRLVAYATEAEMNAATPRNNTFGIVTEVKITEWIISQKEPENPCEGMLWIKTGTSSLGKLDALKKNSIIICPVSAHQYLVDEWCDRTGKTYQDSSWVDWEPEVTYLFKDGDHYIDTTGGWSGIDLSSATITLSKYEQGAVGNSLSTSTVSKVDLSEYGLLSVTLDALCEEFIIYLLDDSGETIAESPVATTTGVVVMDLANITGAYFIKLHVNGTYTNGNTVANFTVSEVKLEK